MGGLQVVFSRFFAGKAQKNAILFAHINFLLYLCSRFLKRVSFRTQKKVSIYYLFGDGLAG